MNSISNLSSSFRFLKRNSTVNGKSIDSLPKYGFSSFYKPRYLNKHFSSPSIPLLSINSKKECWGNSLNHQSKWKLNDSNEWTMNKKRSIYSKADKVKRTTLEDVAKKELLDSKSKEELTKIWVEHHRTQDGLAGVCSSKQFQEVKLRSSHCPIFVLPLIRGEGSLTVLTRSEMDSKSTNVVYFTLMHMYQEQGPATPPILTLYFFTDYEKSKDIVLMKGVYDPLKRTNVTPDELQALVQLWQIFLLDDAKYLLMRTFNHEAEKFDYNEVIKASSTLSVGVGGSSLSFQQSGVHFPPKVEVTPSGESEVKPQPIILDSDPDLDTYEIQMKKMELEQSYKDVANQMVPPNKFKEEEIVPRKPIKQKK
eukprot:TRINITY_DN6170_c0_g2_i1.p1 TRINITY_DN6170_c0_g2~~TRINITY_DN6170_c0_g2_i1.p1  ORF type:complete len:366 (-),score=100.79 TRINITY_DN6170_c0_g2_i1:37-1134(-)